ncbi:MAG: acyl-CoA thioesterase [Pigmentiphaga sp.]|nr:acyl-CoA thioesterase [Pigmentiphaga sp.]
MSVHFSRPYTIRFSDCDPAGIVFFPQYFVMFNGTVEDWITDGLGIGYRTLVIERRTGMPTVHLDVDFTAISLMGDEVVLELEVIRLGSKSLKLEHRCVGLDGTVRARVEQVIVTTSLDTHDSIEIPADLRAAIEGNVAAASAGS